MRGRIVWLGLLSLSVVACDPKARGDGGQGESAQEGSDDKADKKDKKGGKGKGDGSAAPAKSAEAAAPTAKPDAPPPTDTPPPATGTAPPPIVLPPGRSAVPTLAEWDAETREVTVKGSSALGCETKMVREYLRISCKGKNDTGGTPLSVVPQKGAREAYFYSAGGVVSVVIPYVQGIDATLAFAWTDKSHPLQIKWPRGAPKPPVLGVFEGAKSPLDGRGAAPGVCAKCEKELAYMEMGASLCEFITSNPDCVSTYGTDCQKLKECAYGEPSAMVSCPSGKSAIMGRSCAPVCGPNKSCPAGTTCTEGIAAEPVCQEN